MATAESESKLWVICPVCEEPNPPGRRYCQHCWGAAIRLGKTATTEEAIEILKRRNIRLKRQKLIKIIAVMVSSICLVIGSTLLTTYFLTDTFTHPPFEINSSSAAGEWSMFRHDIAHTGAAGSNNAPLQGKIKWTYDTGSPVLSSPAIAGGKVYFGSHDFNIYSIDAITGNKVWAFRTGSWVDGSPIVVDNVLYQGSNDGNLYALNAGNGQLIWNYEIRYPIRSTPAVAGGKLYFGADDYYIRALDLTSGKDVWSFKTGAYVSSSPVIMNGIVYSGSVDRYCYAIDTRNGGFRLYINSYFPVYSSPAFDKGTVYFTDQRGALMAFNGGARNWPEEHEVLPFWLQMSALGMPVPVPPRESGFLWGLSLGKASESSPAIANDILYAGADDKMFAVDLKTHKKLWEFKTGGFVTGSPAVANDTVYFGSEDGNIYALDAATGARLWEIKTGGKVTSSPALVDGLLYIGSHDGKLYAIE